MKVSSIRIDLQNDDGLPHVPDEDSFAVWVKSALQTDFTDLEQTIRVVRPEESRLLNLTYRGIDRPTNVLSFPADESSHLDYSYLGDLIICADLVHAEADQQNKKRLSHWAHLVIHGMLHLQGYDHTNTEDAQQMETLEIEIMASLGHTNPYQITNENVNG